MAFFPVPAQPTDADVADALSLAIVSGSMGRRQTAAASASLDEAFAHAGRYRDEVARAARGWVVEAQALGGTEDDVAARLRGAVTVASALVAGLVKGRVSPDQALGQVSRLRDRVWPAVRSLGGPDGAWTEENQAAVTVMAGVLQGVVAGGGEPAQALLDLRGRHPEFAAAARSLSGLVADRTPEGADPAASLGVASGMYATAVSGLVGRGEAIGDALHAARAQREAISARAVAQASGPATADLPAAEAPAVAAVAPILDVVMPAPSQWRLERAAGLDAPAAQPPRPKGPSA